MAAQPPVIDRTALRRLVLQERGLWSGSGWPGPTAVRDAVAALGSIQMDPLTIVARSHDLVLRNRVPGYARGGLAAMLYEDRDGFEYGGLLAAHPIATLPHWRHHMAARRNQPKVADARAALGDDGAGIILAIRAGRPMTARQVAGALGDSVDRRIRAGAPGSYRSQSVVNQVLYALWLGGDLMTHHRDGFERAYDLPERVAPAELLRPADRDMTDAFFAEQAVRRGLVTTRGAFRSTLGYFQQRVIPAAEANRILDGMIAAGQVTTITVEGVRGPRLVMTDLLAGLDRVGSEADGNPPVRLLSPLDPLIGRLARDLFDFDHVWEIYKPAEKRRWGPFTMPILFGDQLVGRIDAKTDRDRGSLIINGAWIERAGVVDDPGFIAALARDSRELATFAGVEAVEVARTDPATLRALLRRAITD